LHRARRQADGLAQCRKGGVGIALQPGQQLVVEFVEREGGSGHAIFLRLRA
jgi:hypothetical protein